MAIDTENLNQHGASEFAQSMSGTCLCGGISVQLNQEDLFTKRNGHTCSCSNCRKFTGGLGAHGLITSVENVVLNDPKNQVKVYENGDTRSGNIINRHFCSVCSSPMLFIVPAHPDVVIVPLGIFPKAPVPEFEFFASHRHEWQPGVEGVVAFETVPGDMANEADNDK